MRQRRKAKQSTTRQPHSERSSGPIHSRCSAHHPISTPERSAETRTAPFNSNGTNLIWPFNGDTKSMSSIRLDGKGKWGMQPKLTHNETSPKEKMRGVSDDGSGLRKILDTNVRSAHGVQRPPRQLPKRGRCVWVRAVGWDGRLFRYRAQLATHHSFPSGFVDGFCTQGFAMGSEGRQ